MTTAHEPTLAASAGAPKVSDGDMIRFWRTMALTINGELIKRCDRIEELEATIARLRAKLATALPVEVQPPSSVREYVAMVMEGEYSADDLRFVVYNDVAKDEWLMPSDIDSLRSANAKVPQRDTHFKLTAQDNLEAQYKVLLDRGYSGFEIAQHLARYAEAGTYNRLTAEIEKLKDANADLARLLAESRQQAGALESALHEAQANERKPMRVVRQPDFVIDLEDDQ